ncbi:MAG: bifunctional (p)ppGpp synthetase/guanosine-3',5'-bis(diphosphate) 3'-pyrophosphohydrolase [Chloroflexi bacterium]|nr:bifunctional (p)ppGpp synthetase/guanosine-3',5'-bis(diphosphate) 3'-pyrophosphohydrolase [Chloroflexota bacterium]
MTSTVETSLDTLTAELLDRVERSFPSAVERVTHAISYAREAHGEQLRASGEPYFIHPLEVAIILLDLGMDEDSVIAALLHDVIEDTPATRNDLTETFGDTVTTLVEGVSKLKRVKAKSRVDHSDLDEEQAENLRKMVLAMVDDVRVVIIKLADRLHNMRTLGYLPPERQARVARETMDIFAPLANRLGIWQLKWQLEDLAFRYLEPEQYYAIARLVAQQRAQRSTYLEHALAILRSRLDQEGLHYRITGRSKHLYSIYHKMQEKDREFDQIYDLHGIRVIVEQERECYHALGAIHSLWRPIAGEFDDYIALPKDNGYQSLHTAVIALEGRPLEVQIRTEGMHQVAEYGVAAHWRYKEGLNRDLKLEQRLNLLLQARELPEESENALQFATALKGDLFAERVYVFTPKGDIVDLPAGSTPVDFAYLIHSEIGHRCRGAKIDGRLVSLDYQLHTGDQVEIVTAKQGGPSRDWLNPHLNYVATQRARQKIRRWFRAQEREQNIGQGRELLDRELRRLGFDQEAYAEIAALFGFDSVEDFLEALGYGDISASQIATKIDQASGKSEKLRFQAIPERAVTDIRVKGVGDLYTRMATCCTPVPGDSIIGYITRGKGVTVHRLDCPNVVHMQDRERLVSVSWGEARDRYPVQIEIQGIDRRGLLRDIAAEIADLGINMSSAHVTTHSDNTATVALTVGVEGVSQLSVAMSRLQGIRDVLDVRRQRSG